MRNQHAVFNTISCLSIAALLVAGCTVATSGQGTTPNAYGTAQATAGAGVTVVESSCTQGAQEQCNGLDDNCNGAIDEGCGWQSGAIQITASWDTGADIDMYVTDPTNTVISYQNTSSPTGGQLDHDARGQCAEGENNNIENVFWSNTAPPHGNYQVALDYYSPCDVAGPTTANVSVAVGGQVIGVYRITLNPGQNMVPVTSFTL